MLDAMATLCETFGFLAEGSWWLLDAADTEVRIGEETLHPEARRQGRHRAGLGSGAALIVDWPKETSVTG